MNIPGFICLDKNAELGSFKFQCTNCNDILDGGIINLSSHFAKCGGKEFQEAMIQRRLERGEINNKDIEEFQHLIK